MPSSGVGLQLFVFTVLNLAAAGKIVMDATLLFGVGGRWRNNSTFRALTLSTSLLLQIAVSLVRALCLVLKNLDVVRKVLRVLSDFIEES